MKLLGSTKSKITNYENDENVSCLEITEVVCSIVILSTMIIKKIQASCMHLLYLYISHLQIYIIKNSQFSYIEFWFTDGNSKQLEIDDQIIIALVIN